MNDEGSKDLKVMLGDPKKAILAMTGPLIISFLVVQINSFADSAWCSFLGLEPSSAVSTISPIYWIVTGIGTGLGVGASTAIARRLGAGDKAGAEGLVSQTMVVGTILSIALTPIFWFILDPSISMMGADELGNLCRAYIDPIVICTVALILNGIVSGMLRAEGAAKRSTAMLCVAAVLNIVLDPILMFTLDMGVAGAGWATAISTIVSTAIGLYWYLRGSMYLRMIFKGFRFDRGLILEMLSVGVPRSVELTIISGMAMIQLIVVIAQGGTLGPPLFSMTWKYISLAQVVSQATSSALIPIMSAALGQEDVERARVANAYTLRITMISMVANGALLFLFAEWAVIPITMSESMAVLRPEFVDVLRIYAVIIPFIGLIDIGSSVLQSIRMANQSMISSFLRNIVVIVLMCVASLFSLEAMFYSILVAEIFGAVLMIGLAVRGFRKSTGRPLLGLSRENPAP